MQMDNPNNLESTPKKARMAKWQSKGGYEREKGRSQMRRI